MLKIGWIMVERVKVIKVAELCAGSRSSEPLFFDDGKHMFLPRDFPLTQHLINTLIFWNIPHVVTCGLEIFSPIDEGAEDDIPELEVVG